MLLCEQSKHLKPFFHECRDRFFVWLDNLSVRTDNPTMGCLLGSTLHTRKRTNWSPLPWVTTESLEAKKAKDRVRE